jgi:hypothetical protein
MIQFGSRMHYGAPTRCKKGLVHQAVQEGVLDVQLENVTYAMR